MMSSKFDHDRSVRCCRVPLNGLDGFSVFNSAKYIVRIRANIIKTFPLRLFFSPRRIITRITKLQAREKWISVCFYLSQM